MAYIHIAEVYQMTKKKTQSEITNKFPCTVIHSSLAQGEDTDLPTDTVVTAPQVTTLERQGEIY